MPEASWRDAVETIATAKEVALACHMGPDGDALGSMLALGLALRKRGMTVNASWGSDPFSVPKHYTFLPGQELLKPPQDFPAAPPLMITFDAGSIERLGTLEPNARKAETLIVVDHHVSNDEFGTLNLIDPKAAASAILVFELIKRLGIDLDTEIATNLYTAILTDTGSFKYRNTTPPVHAIAAELLQFDIHHDDIARTVFDTHPVGFLKLAAVALERAQLRDDASMIWTWVAQDDLKRFDLELEDTESLIDILRTADTAEVACVMKQGLDGKYKASLRSKGNANVGAVAQQLGGGGHAFAAGFTANGDPHAAVDEIARRLATA
ncbi:MAG: bifunctional oligoribonuclease/PAP phosphatase NrnA [Actinobacteria bacterium]|nr:bifunctional oligoribonuclease/PAP phosphatase NrnA [Actinomycetota bacterium]